MRYITSILIFVAIGCGEPDVRNMSLQQKEEIAERGYEWICKFIQAGDKEDELEFSRIRKLKIHPPVEGENAIAFDLWASVKSKSGTRKIHAVFSYHPHGDEFGNKWIWGPITVGKKTISPEFYR